MDQTVSTANAPRAALESLFVSALPDIERITRFVARRNRLSPADAEDFCSEVNVALIENDYAALGSYQGRSSLPTYLSTVIQRRFLDFRRKAWGKWRSSAEALRRGPLAERMERLLYRDGLTFEQAVETLRTNFACAEDREVLTEIAQALPYRTTRRSIVGEAEELDQVPAGELENPEIQIEGRRISERAQSLIEVALERLSPQDRLVLRLRFEDNQSVADVARALHLEQKRLYRRLEEILGAFRKSLEENGLGWPDLVRMIERGQCHLRLPPIAPESRPARPSLSETRT